jgi:hypothetical protein
MYQTDTNKVLVKHSIETVLNKDNKLLAKHNAMLVLLVQQEQLGTLHNKDVLPQLSSNNANAMKKTSMVNAEDAQLINFQETPQVDTSKVDVDLIQLTVLVNKH